MTVPINGPMARIDAPALVDLLGRWSQADGPLYRLLAARLGRLADSGGLTPGLRLPPERELADALSVSRNTVAMAYQMLRDDGMAESRQGSGTRLVPHRTTPAAVHRANGFFTGMLETSSGIDLTLAAVDCAPQVAAALDDPSSVLSARERRTLTEGSGYLPYGQPSLRAALADMLTSRHELPTGAERVLLTTGAQQALDLLIRCEVMPGQAAVVRGPDVPRGVRRAATSGRAAGRGAARRRAAAGRGGGDARSGAGLPHPDAPEPHWLRHDGGGPAVRRGARAAVPRRDVRRGHDTRGGDAVGGATGRSAGWPGA